MLHHVVRAHVEAKVGAVQVVDRPVGAVGGASDGEEHLDHEDPEDRNVRRVHHLGDLVR